MLELILLRHGKSDWNAAYGRDHDRPLATRGIAAARRVGKFLQAADMIPDWVLTSSAVRAATTVELAAEAGGWRAPVEVVGDLYGGSPQTVLRTVQGQADVVRRLLIAGHEPTWSAFVSLAMGGGAVRFPTACVAALRFEVERWADVDFGDGELLWLIPPRLLG